MSVKYTQDQVKNIFANSGCELLSPYYSAREPVQYMCSCGTISFISVDNFVHGQRCKKCGYQKSAKVQGLSQEYISQYFKMYSCVLLDIYINNRTLVKYRCSCGNISFIRFEAFQTGHRCKSCGSIKISTTHSGEKHWNWNPDREQVQLYKEIRERQKDVLKSCLKRLGTIKEGHTHEILGYSAVELDNHLRSFPMYAYLQDTHTLAIDHILPVKAFIDHGIKTPRIICALDNLQPLSRSENCEKNDWYLEEDFLAYCQKHDISLLKEAI